MSWKDLVSKNGGRYGLPPPAVVRGTFRIAAAALPNPEYSRHSGWWAGVLTGVGLTPVVVMHKESALVDKWPEQGETVPVTVTLSSPPTLKIIWDEVPTRREKGFARAEQLLNELLAP